MNRTQRWRARLFVALALTLVTYALVCVRAQSADVSYERRADVIYGRKAGLALTMEVFAPAKTNGRGVIWVVSSSGQSNRDMTLQPSFEHRVMPLLARGYVVFATIHGSTPTFNVADYVEDVARAVRFVRYRAADFGVQPQKLGIAGSSSGGLIALAVAMRAAEGKADSNDPVDRVPSRVQAAGCFFPLTDLLNFGPAAMNIIDYLRRQTGRIDPAFQFFDADPDTGGRLPIVQGERLLQVLRAVSPVSGVTRASPPTLLIHGDQDLAVPVQQSHILVERLHQVNVPVRLIVREGKGHAYPGWEADTALMANWFDEYLRK